MKIYKEEIDNRNKIINYSTKLFYEKGINNTSLNEIANFCGVTKPLITYHFETKANLAKEVLDNISAYIKNYVSEKIYKNFDHYNLQHSTAAEIILTMRLYYEDEKARRFFCEYLNFGFETQLSTDFIKFFKIHDRQYHLNINRNTDELTMLSTAATFSLLSLMYSYFTGRINCTFEQVLDYALRTMFKFMKIDDNKIDESIRESKNILDKLDFKILPYFRIE